MITALFWSITKQVMVIPYRLFGTTYRFHLQGSRRCDRYVVSRNVVKELPLPLRNSPEERGSQLNSSLMKEAPLHYTREIESLM